MSLTDSLTAYWKFDSDGNSATGSNNLTAATPSFALGKIGGAASFTGAGSGNHWSVSSNADVQMGDIDFSIACWVMLETDKSDYRFLVAKDDTASGREYTLYYDPPADRIIFIVFNGGSTSRGSVQASALGSPALDTWYFVHAYHSATDNEVGISVNGGTVNTASTSGALGTNATDFTVGASSAAGSVHVGRLDELGMWKKKLPAGEIAQLYNGGSGLTYPFSAPSFRVPRLRPAIFTPGLAR